MPLDKAMVTLGFVASVSPRMREKAKADPSLAQKHAEFAAYAIRVIVPDERIVASLTMPQAGGQRVMRQVDIYEYEGGPLQAKTFTGWNREYNCWHVMIEEPDETVYEDDRIDYSRN